MMNYQETTSRDSITDFCDDKGGDPNEIEEDDLSASMDPATGQNYTNQFNSSAQGHVALDGAYAGMQCDTPVFVANDKVDRVRHNAKGSDVRVLVHTVFALFDSPQPRFYGCYAPPPAEHTMTEPSQSDEDR